MITKTSIQISILLATATSALALHIAGGLDWHVPEGATLRRELITTQLLATQSMTFRQGEESTVSQRIFDLKATTTLRTSDQLRAVGEGRPTTLRRFYDEVRIDAESELSGGRQQTRSIDFVGNSPFQGKSVVFTWVPEDEVYGRYFDGIEGHEETLPGLVEDLGARSLLPAEAVAEGATWELPVGALRDLLAPGGDLALGFEEPRDPLIARSMVQGVGANLHRAFGGEETGEVKATWSSTTEVEGRRLAVISLEFDVQLSKDIKEFANEMRAINEIAAGQETVQALLAVQLEGSGEVRWDLEAGCMFDTVGLRADQELSFSRKVEMKQGDEVVSTEQVLEMTGSILQKSSVTLER